MPYEEGLVSVSSTHPPDVARTKSLRPSAVVRLAARLRWFSLDARLITGEDPANSALLTAHAARLTSPRSREAIADGLAALLRAAEQPARTTRVSPDRSAVLANRQALEALAERLESPAAVYAPGVARLERLISDSTGPAFAGGMGALEDELENAASELGGAAPHKAAAGASPSSGDRRLGRPLRIGPRRFVRLVRRGEPRPAVEPPGFVGSSFSLPDGSWFHGRRDS